MTNADIADEWVRLCREGTKEEVMAFHRKHQQKILEELEARTNRNPKKEN